MQCGRARQCQRGSQILRQVPIDLHGIKTGVLARQQQMREGAASRSDLQQVIGSLRLDRPRNPLDDAGIVEEVLAEALAGLSHAGVTLACAAMLVAMRTAAARLAASARPVPARSSAVP